MPNPFLEHPILNSPYDYPSRHMYEIEADFKEQVEGEFNKLIEAATTPAATTLPAELRTGSTG